MAAALGAALLAGCAGGAGSPEAPGGEESSVSQDPPGEPSAGSGEEMTTTPSESPSAGPDDGAWQDVSFGNGTFSVPPSWEIDIVGEGDAETPRPVHGRGFCPDDPSLVTALALVTWTDETTDAHEAVAAEAERAAQHFYPGRSPRLTLDEVDDGGEWATVFAGVAMRPSDDPCDAPEAMLIVRGVPYPDGSGTFLFLVLGELGLPGSPPEDDLVRIASSLRT
ncbi:hypothetical protein Bcav_0890 [Beutenbergia cavernae DSM 12333]|uniref:DUF8017 domain-containing protein n=1 Tax=Beutenbergia cavernae (strain ATCC BAA-8 / DSM 12333 / CCUG 43141 / JCM 11478 / NBRC 16432 / NCIMB 13614 / HKI 0122) TaxID=471853 RepID=C5BZH9_BEUC1|nr:hypothetical protein Bcav_0890 [Beutenbergia cavernae DSM 12333]